MFITWMTDEFMTNWIWISSVTLPKLCKAHQNCRYRLIFVCSSTGEHLAKMPKNRVFGFSNRVSGLLERIFGVFWSKFHGFYRVFEENSDFWDIFTPKSWNFWLKIEFLKILKSSFCQKSSSLTFGQIEFLSNRTKKKPDCR